MEDEHHHHHPHHHHYGGGGGSNPNAAPPMADLRQFFSPIPTHHHFHHGLSSSAAAASAFAAPLPHHHYDAMMLVMAGGGAIHDAAAPSAAMMPPAAASGGGFDMEAAVGGGGGGFGLGVGGGGDGATARWPRQETLTLLEIRSRLDHKFKEANHKGPLWDEVSRIMSEEHGYQRSGKKCREKFENLYKYYKKTKEGKAGRQDGKHYRFFRQLEALYGESSSNINHHHSNPISDHAHLNYNSTPTSIPIHNPMNAAAVNGQCSNQQEGFQSMSLSNTSSDFDTASSEGNEIDRVGSMEINGDSSMDVMGRSSGRKRRGTRRSWKAKIKEFIDSQMRKIMDRQEAWLEKMMRTLEHKEKERVMREEEWRKQEGLRVEREHKFWAKERAWIEARDKALMDALQRITGKEMVVVMDNDDMSSERRHKPHRLHHDDDDDDEEVKHGDHRWDESEMIKLIELRASMQGRFDECGGSTTDEGDLWEEVSARMACLGHDRSAKMCKRRWDFFNKELSKKRKESSRTGATTIDCNTKSHNTYQQQQHHQEHHLQTPNNLYSYGEINGQGGMGLGPPQIGLGGGNPMNDSCLRILLGDQGETHAWESYGVKLNKGDQTH